jgi:hypothetical protein
VLGDTSRPLPIKYAPGSESRNTDHYSKTLGPQTYPTPASQCFPLQWFLAPVPVKPKSKSSAARCPGYATSSLPLFRTPSFSTSDHSHPSDHFPSISATMALSSDDVQTMYSLLLNSLSSDVSVRKPAEDALSQCENRPGFCSCLLVIISSYSIHYNFVRNLGCCQEISITHTIPLSLSLLYVMILGNNYKGWSYWEGRCETPGLSLFQKQYKSLLEAKT